MKPLDKFMTVSGVVIGILGVIMIGYALRSTPTDTGSNESVRKLGTPKVYVRKDSNHVLTFTNDPSHSEHPEDFTAVPPPKAKALRLTGRYSPDEIKSALFGKTREDLVALIGRPDEVGDTYWQYDLFTFLHGSGGDDFASPYSFEHLRHGFFVHDPLSGLYFKSVLIYFTF